MLADLDDVTSLVRIKKFLANRYSFRGDTLSIMMYGTHLSFCWSNRPDLPEAGSAGDSAPSAVARGRTRILPLPARVAARRHDWRRKPRTDPSYCGNECAEKMGIDWRTTSWSQSCRASWHCTSDSPSPLFSLLYPGPLPGPTSLFSTVPRLFKRDFVQERTPRDQVAPKKQEETIVIMRWSRLRKLEVSRKLIESESMMIRCDTKLFLEEKRKIERQDDKHVSHLCAREFSTLRFLWKAITMRFHFRWL